MRRKLQNAITGIQSWSRSEYSASKVPIEELFKGTRCEFWEGSEDAKETQHVQPTGAATRNRTRDLEEEGEFGVRCSVFGVLPNPRF